MGYPVQPNAPQFQVGTDKYALGAFVWNGGPVGSYYIFGLYRLDAAQGWITVQDYRLTSVLDDMKAKGGKDKYMAWIKQLFNNWFKAVFVATAPAGEPTTEAEAQAAFTAFVNSLAVAVANGVPSV